MRLDVLIDYLDGYLDASSQPDFCPNGLQVEGAERVERVVVGVTACQELFEAARARGAGLVIVHHGLFWSGWEPRIRGVMRHRLAFLLEHGISLAAYHLPLDRHAEVGNNARIAKALGMHDCHGFAPCRGAPVGLVGELPEALGAEAFRARVETVLGEVSHSFPFGPDRVRRVAILSGKGDHDLEAAILAGAHAFLTGEAGVSTRELAREAGVHYLAAGHHRTECWGVQALGEHLGQRFGLPWEFIDVENPV